MLKKDQVAYKFVGSLITILLLITAVTASPAASAGEDQISLNFIGLEDLGPGWVYEGWLIVDGAPVSTGVFTVDEDGNPSTSNFTVDSEELINAASFVVTIEPSPDSDPAPSAVHVLGGDIIGGVALLTLDHPAALGDGFLEAFGSYILAAPSGGEEAAYANGIWWLDPEGGPGAGLDLPTLPEGWVYEGWVVGPDGPISTGRFASVSGSDSDGAGPTAGTEATPPFPGQDFIDPPLDLTEGYAAVISIEPEPDNSSAPFAFKPLIDDVIEDVGEGTLQAMTPNPGSFSSGTVTLSTLIVAEEAATEEEAMAEQPATEEAVPQEEGALQEEETETAATESSTVDEAKAEVAPAALPTVGADRSLPLLPITLGVTGLFILGLGVVIRKRL